MRLNEKKDWRRKDSSAPVNGQRPPSRRSSHCHPAVLHTSFHPLSNVYKYVLTQNAQYRLILTRVQDRPIRCAIFFSIGSSRAVCMHICIQYPQPHLCMGRPLHIHVISDGRQLCFLGPLFPVTHLFFSPKIKVTLLPPPFCLLCCIWLAF